MTAAEQDRVLTTSEVARLMHVAPKTVSRWVEAGKLVGFKTLGGHRRFHESEVQAAIERANP